MSMKHAVLILGFAVAMPSLALAQGTVRGAEEGADSGAAAAGPVGGVVGGAVGAATGTVGGALGVHGDRGGCGSKTVRREDDRGNSETTRRTDCP